MSMFTNYDNLPSSYIPNNMCKKNVQIGNYPPKKPYVVYNAAGEEVGYRWKFRDTVILNFKITGNVTYSADSNDVYDESIATYMSEGEQEIVFRIFNFRYEMIYEAHPLFHANSDGSVDVIVFIYDELSDVLVKGKYYVSLEIAGKHPNPSDPTAKEIKVRQNIFDPDTCPIIID